MPDFDSDLLSKLTAPATVQAAIQDRSYFIDSNRRMSHHPEKSTSFPDEIRGLLCLDPAVISVLRDTAEIRGGWINRRPDLVVTLSFPQTPVEHLEILHQFKDQLCTQVHGLVIRSLYVLFERRLATLLSEIITPSGVGGKSQITSVTSHTGILGTKLLDKDPSLIFAAQDSYGYTLVMGEAVPPLAQKGVLLPVVTVALSSTTELGPLASLELANLLRLLTFSIVRSIWPDLRLLHDEQYCESRNTAIEVGGYADVRSFLLYCIRRCPSPRGHALFNTDLTIESLLTAGLVIDASILSKGSLGGVVRKKFKSLEV